MEEPKVQLPDIVRDLVLKNKSNAAVIVKDGVVVEVNDAWLVLHRYERREDAVGRPISAFMTPESAQICEERIARRIAGQKLSPTQIYDFVRGDGTIARFETVAFAWPADPTIVVGIHLDVTERERSLQALRESELLYRKLAEAIPGAVLFADAAGRNLFVNDNCCELTGYSREELLGGVWLLHPEEKEAEEMHRRAFEEGLPGRHYETRFVRKDGSVMWVSCSWEPIIGPDGKLEGVCSTFLDVTHQVQAREALRETQERYRTLAENASDTLWQMDTSGKFLYVSPAIRAYGYEPEDFIGHHMTEFLPEHEQKMFRERSSRDVSNPGPRRYEVQMCRVDGSLVWMEVSLDFVFDGSKVYLQGIARDISERKEAEEIFLKAHADLEKAYNLQRQFLNSVTHEVRTPLTAVQGYVEMLLEGVGGELSDQQTALLQKVLASSKSLLEIVDSTLQTARVRSGTAVLRPTACNPCNLLKRAVSVIEPQVAAKGLELHVKTCTGIRTGLYDEEKVTVILNNILSNAVKFTDRGAIEVIADSNPEGISVVIADTGPGISGRDLGKIFDEFQQLDYPGKHKASGFGLGLSIVASMVEAVGATLIVSSRKGIGTAFTIHIPSLKP